MDISGIKRYTKNINRITFCVCVFLLLKILLSENINITGARGAVCFAVLTPLLCWSHSRSLEDTQKNMINRNKIDVNLPDSNEYDSQLSEAEEIADEAETEYKETEETPEEENNTSAANTEYDDMDIAEYKHIYQNYSLKKKSRKMDI